MIIGIMIGLSVGLLAGSSVTRFLFDGLAEAKHRNSFLTARIHQLLTGKELA